MQERWPPIYDADSLRQAIQELQKDGWLYKNFYAPKGAVDHPFQGDIIHLDSEIPLISENGEPEAINNPFEHWLVIGNTCDINRAAVDENLYSQIVPIVAIEADAIPAQKKADLTNYSLTRRFFLPPWSAEFEGRFYFAEFMQPVTIHKRALIDVAKVVGSMRRESWLLLNSCLVRFLARDDGRFD